MLPNYLEGTRYCTKAEEVSRGITICLQTTTVQLHSVGSRQPKFLRKMYKNWKQERTKKLWYFFRWCWNILFRFHWTIWVCHQMPFFFSYEHDFFDWWVLYWLKCRWHITQYALFWLEVSVSLLSTPTLITQSNMTVGFSESLHAITVFTQNSSIIYSYNPRCKWLFIIFVSGLPICVNIFISLLW